MIISEIQNKIAYWSCYSSKSKAPADFSHQAILAKKYVGFADRKIPFVHLKPLPRL